MNEEVYALMENVGANRHILLEILGFCEKPRSSEEIDALVEPLLRYRRSVYTPIIFRDMLKKSGALEYIFEETEDDEAVEAMGNRDGELLVVAERPDGLWLSTPSALEYLKEHNPQTALAQLLDKELDLRPIFLRILEFCAEKDRTASELSALVDDDPLVQHPRRMSGYFVAKLEDLGVLVWEGAWKTSALGLSALGATEDLSHEGGADNE